MKDAISPDDIARGVAGLVLMLMIDACGAAPAHPPPPRREVVAVPAVTTPPTKGDGGASLASSEEGQLLTLDEVVTLADGTKIALRTDRGRSCVEISTLVDKGCVEVAKGSTQTASDRWAVYVDAESHARVRAIQPSKRAIGGRSVTLQLGDRVVIGEFELQWVGVKHGAIALGGVHKNKPVAEWLVKETVGQKSEHVVSNGLINLEVSLAAMNGDPDRPGSSIVLMAIQNDQATPATFGQALSSGTYLFADGLRLRYKNNTACDFDPTAPCAFAFEVQATFDHHDDQVVLNAKKRTARLVGHALEINSNQQLIVRK